MRHDMRFAHDGNEYYTMLAAGKYIMGPKAVYHVAESNISCTKSAVSNETALLCIFSRELQEVQWDPIAPRVPP